MPKTKQITIALGTMLTLAAYANAGTIDFSTTTPVGDSGVNLDGLTGTTAISGAPTWNESTSGLFKIMPNIGPDGSQAMISAQGIKTASVYYTANTAVTGAAFVAQQTVLKMSFDFNVVKSTSSAELYRIYLGAVNGSSYLGYLAIYGNGSVGVAGEDVNNASTSWSTTLTTGAYHSVDLTVDFSNNTWSATFDDNESLSTTQYFIFDASNYTTATNSSNYGYKNILKFNVRNNFDATQNQVAFDNFTFEAVPEPAALSILSLGALALCSKRRSF